MSGNDKKEDIENSVKGNIEQWYTSISKDNDKLLVLYYFWVNTVKCKYCNHEIDLFKSRIFSKNAVPKKDSTARSVCPKCNANQAVSENPAFKELIPLNIIESFFDLSTLRGAKLRSIDMY